MASPNRDAGGEPEFTGSEATNAGTARERANPVIVAAIIGAAAAIIAAIAPEIIRAVIGASQAPTVVAPATDEPATASPLPTTRPESTAAADTETTLTPLAPPEQCEVLFEDNFDDNSNEWPDWDSNLFWIEDGHYHVSLGKDQARHVFSEGDYFEWRDFAYTASVATVDGKGSYSYSLLFRAHYPGPHTWQRFYSFEMIPNEQVYNVERPDFNVSDTGVGWPSALIWRGYARSVDRQANSHTLTVVAKDNVFTFYVDDQHIDTLIDVEDLYERGTIGLEVSGAHVAIDYVRVCALSQ